MNIDYYKIYQAEYLQQDDIKFLSNELLSGIALEVGCGTGRILSELIKLRKDIKFFGIDIDNKAIKIAKTKFNKKAVIKVHDALKYIDKNNFDNIFFMFNGLMLINKDYQLLALKNFYTNLKKNGKLILSISNPCPERMSEKFSFYKYQKTLEIGSYKIDKFEFNKYFLDEQRISRVFNYDFIKKNGSLSRIQSRFDVWYLFKNQLLTMLRQAGFKNIKVYSNFKKTPWEKNSDLTVAIAEKL